MATILTTGTGAARWISREPGCGRLSCLLTGPSAGDDDDDLNGSSTEGENIEDYFETLTGMFVGGAISTASAGVIPRLITTDGKASEAIINYFEAGTASASLDQCDNGDNLSTLKWWVTFEGTPKNSA
jgi:hypothetical protein